MPEASKVPLLATPLPEPNKRIFPPLVSMPFAFIEPSLFTAAVNRSPETLASINTCAPSIAPSFSMALSTPSSFSMTSLVILRPISPSASNVSNASSAAAKLTSSALINPEDALVTCFPTNSALDALITPRFTTIPDEPSSPWKIKSPFMKSSGFISSPEAVMAPTFTVAVSVKSTPRGLTRITCPFASIDP
ncbi:hypothetical protein Misp06_04455 [Microbulbifer sp. NBRC 101763]